MSFAHYRSDRTFESPKKNHVEQTLVLRFDAKITIDRHPYGDTHAEQTTYEPIEQTFTYEINDCEVHLSYLQAKFGESFVDKLIDEMVDDSYYDYDQ